MSPDDILSGRASLRIVQLGPCDYRLRMLCTGGVGDGMELTSEPFRSEEEAFEALADRIDCIEPDQIMRVQ